MTWPHRLKVWNPKDAAVVPAVQDPTTGVPIPGTSNPPPPVYENLADVQDKPLTVLRGTLGEQVVKSDMKVFLYDESRIGLIKPEMLAEITWEDASTDIATVVEVTRLDGSLLLRRGYNA